MDEAVDEAIGDGVNGMNAFDGRQLRSKESDYTLRSGNSNVLQSHEVVTLGESNNYHNAPDLYLEGKNLDRIGSSEHASASPRCMDDSRIMVEELMLRNHSIGPTGYKEKMPNQWFQLGGGSSCGSSHGDMLFTGLLNQNQNTLCEKLHGNSDKDVSNNVSLSSEGIRTKILSKSGFSEYIVKSTLKGKGVVCKTQIPRVSPNSLSTVPAQVSNMDTSSANPEFDQDDGISLRERLKAGGSKLNKAEGLCIFKQVVDLVDFSHSQGIILQELLPSFFKLLRSNQVVYLGASGRTLVRKNTSSLIDPCVKKQKLSEDTSLSKLRLPQLPVLSKTLLTSTSFKLEENWYTSPEQFSEGGCTFASNIYCLGILLFELLSSFDCERSHADALRDLCHRILPSSFLSEHPKEAGFCLWLLHPEASARPTTREILQSEFIVGIKELSGDVSLASIHEDESGSELLLYFLMSLKDQKQKDASKLVEELKCIEADVTEIQRRQSSKAPFLSLESSDVYQKQLPIVRENRTRLTKNIRQLETAYFSTRSNVNPSDGVAVVRRTQEIFSGSDTKKHGPVDRVGGFFDGLCKYARYSKFRVRGILRNADLNNSANVICSLSFDRDEEYLAAGGVSKKIKVFEYNALFNDSVDIHYPVIEMSNKSKLSCISWNSYIRNYLATTDYDGAVKLWDASTGQSFSHLTEHNERAWSVDFSRVAPTKLASGSDDHLVKIWSINEKNSLCTIRNKANVCCVQFSPNSSHFLAYSSADYKTYCYDLRNIATPWCILSGHEKAVSYAKFLDAETLVSASTDNSLKIWDLNKANSRGYSADACVSTLKGHTNEKNFVGLSVNDGYITCGSETNEVFAYYKSQPMPITSRKFGSVNPIFGKETDDDNGQFVSSVCWRRKSNTVLAANSTGCIKLFELV